MHWLPFAVFVNTLAANNFKLHLRSFMVYRIFEGSLAVIILRFPAFLAAVHVTFRTNMVIILTEVVFLVSGFFQSGTATQKSILRLHKAPHLFLGI